jgi:hypothetical protein
MRTGKRFARKEKKQIELVYPSVASLRPAGFQRNAGLVCSGTVVWFERNTQAKTWLKY